MIYSLLYKSSVLCDSPNRNILLYTIGTIIYAIIHLILYSDIVKNSQFIQKYRKILYAIVVIDLICFGYSTTHKRNMRHDEHKKIEKSSEDSKIEGSHSKEQIEHQNTQPDNDKTKKIGDSNKTEITNSHNVSSHENNNTNKESHKCNGDLCRLKNKQNEYENKTVTEQNSDTTDVKDKTIKDIPNKSCDSTSVQLPIYCSETKNIHIESEDLPEYVSHEKPVENNIDKQPDKQVDINDIEIKQVDDNK